MHFGGGTPKFDAGWFWLGYLLQPALIFPVILMHCVRNNRIRIDVDIPGRATSLVGTFAIVVVVKTITGEGVSEADNEYQH